MKFPAALSLAGLFALCLLGIGCKSKDSSDSSTSPSVNAKSGSNDKSSPPATSATDDAKGPGKR